MLAAGRSNQRIALGIAVLAAHPSDADGHPGGKLAHRRRGDRSARPGRRSAR
jgi:hypothetical protein